jgi:hypothetical protein
MIDRRVRAPQAVDANHRARCDLHRTGGTSGCATTTAPSHRQDSDFHYLTGFPEPEAVLALIPGRNHGKSSVLPRRDANVRRGRRAPGLKARCATTAWMTHFRLPTSTTSYPA